jgi:Tfp pilus assembly protein PilX
MLRQLTHHLRLDRLRDQRGIAMITAVGVLAFLAIASMSTIAYTTSNQRTAELSADDAQAYTLAEAGFNEMMAILNKQGNSAINPDLLPATTSTYENGTVTWSGTFVELTWRWSLTSTGLVKNSTGSGAAEVRRTLTAEVPVYPQNTQPLGADAWNYVYSYGTGDPDGCDMLINANVDVKTRLMAAGNLCWANGSLQSAGELIVGGTNTVNGSATIGASGAPITRMDANGCRVGTGTSHDPCQGPPANADKVWATTVTSDPEIETTPTVDLNSWYLNASPGPHHPCEAPTGTPPVFENETSPKLRNRSVTGTFNLTPTSSYTCRTTGGGNPLGEISWNHTTKVLTVRGTIFIDGNAYVGQDATYEGQATLYLSGSFIINGSSFCAVMASGVCNFSSGAWDPNTRLLTVVASGDGGQAGVSTGESVVLSGGGNTEWQGAIYGGAYKVNLASGVKASGPVIADEVVLNSSLQQQGFSTISDAPTGMPGNPLVVAQPDEPELYSG